MGNGECHICFEKIQNFQLFLTKTGRRILCGKNYYNTPLNWMALYRLMQKYWHFEAYCEERTQKYKGCPQKNPKIGVFVNNSPKNFSAAESLDNDRSWIRRSVYTKIGWIRRIGPEKIRFEELKRRGMSRTGKKWNHFDVSLCKKASLRSSKNKVTTRGVFY